MNAQDKALLNDLILESREHLAAIEPDLLALETGGPAVADDLINRVFRAVHSIKGGFGFFGVEAVTKLAHAMENVLAQIRDKKREVSPEVTDALLLGMDKLRVLLDDISHAGDISIAEELGRLAPFLLAAAPAAGGTPVPAAADGPADLLAWLRRRYPGIPDSRLVETLRQGKRLYEVELFSEKDLFARNLIPADILDSWEKLGDILDVAPDPAAITGVRGSAAAEFPYRLLFASVLEADLLRDGLEMPAGQIRPLDMALLKAQLKAAAAPPAEAAAAKPESRADDALRVKVALLNNLMNLAGELVLSRNQLLQVMSHPLAQALEGDRILRDFDRAVEQAGQTAQEAAARDPAVTVKVFEDALARIRAAFRRSLSFRLMDLPGLTSTIQDINLVTSRLQENIMLTRLQPVSVVFGKFPRVIRDLAKKLNKEVNLTIIGQDVELDKSIVELLSDPLNHLIRNSVDHGIETPDQRAAAGKPAAGEVVLHAYHEGGKVNIEVHDDGAGLNTVRVREKAVAMRLVSREAAAKMTEAEIHQFIFHPGFSTAAQVSDVSGRGVGMDVVKTNIERLGGTVEIDSEPGRGTRFVLKLPLTLAIISALFVKAEDRRFALPQVGVEELVRIRAADVAKKIERVQNSEVLRLRGRLLPLVRLAAVLGVTPTFRRPPGTGEPDRRSRWSDRRGPEDAPPPPQPQPGEGEDRRQDGERRKNLSNAVKIVVLRSENRLFGLVVDEVSDSEEIVVKALPSYLKSCPWYSGATIMGNGRVAMILDTNGLARQAGLRFTETKEKEREAPAAPAVRESRNLLLFNTGSSEFFALDLAHITRIERRPAAEIERIGGREFIKYKDSVRRLIRLHQYLPVAEPPPDGRDLFVIIPKATDRAPGIAAARIFDAVRTEMALDKDSVQGPGIMGSLIVNSRLTIVLNVVDLLKTADPELFT